MELSEWQYITKPTGSTTNNSSSSGYKKRFEKLIKYHIDHASSELESITVKDIKDYSFRLGEHYNDGKSEFDRDIVASYDKASDTFFFRIFVDGKEVDSILRKGYENFVAAIEPYMFLPDNGTQEYDDLLVEWVAMNNSNTSSQPASSSKTNKEKFTELTDYMMNHKGSLTAKAEVPKVDDTGFTYKEHWTATAASGNGYVLTLVVNYSRFNDQWSYKLYIEESLAHGGKGSGWEDLLEELEKYFHVPKVGSPEHKSLCESASSIAEDFKAYENLWD